MKKITPRHTIIKLLEISGKNKILSQREKKTICTEGKDKYKSKNYANKNTVK